MAVKLDRNTLPALHSREDFEGMGPVVTKDTEWGDGCLADLGCFKVDEGTDSNKFYHLAVVKSTINGKWFAYYEWGRCKPSERPSSPAFQFFDCSSKEDAQATCEKQFRSKNTSRGVWEDVAGRQRFVPKPKKGGTADLYIVRALATRLVGLPCCEKIANDDAQGSAAKPAKKTKKKKKSSPKIDRQTRSLFNDLLGGVQTYAKTFLGSSGGPITLPSQSAVDDARDILIDALRRVGQVESGMARSSTTDQLVAAQISDTDLLRLTKILYGVIPKATRNPAPEDYILNRNNILTWENDIDVLETALHGASMTTEDSDDGNNPLQGIPATVEWIPPGDPIYDWLIGKSGARGKLTGWWPGATRNKSGAGTSALKVHGCWRITRDNDRVKIRRYQEKVSGEIKGKLSERPLFAKDKERPDLNAAERKLFWDTNTSLMFHGTRTVNVPGIVRENLRFPHELTGGVINGAMFGPGCYFADDWGKSAGYCSSRRSYYGGGGGVDKRHSMMFAFDVCLGNPHVAPGSKGYRGSPTGTHCIFGKYGHTLSWGSSTLANNEWIIYEKAACEMRYLAEIEW